MICSAGLTTIHTRSTKTVAKMATVSGWSGPIVHFGTKPGQGRHILCVGNDITDRKAFEAVLEEARVQLTAKIQEQNTQLKKEVAERKKAQEALAESLTGIGSSPKSPSKASCFTTTGLPSR
jgi:trehalose-6-phosphatase